MQRLLALSLFSLSLFMFSFSTLANDPIETGTFNNKAIYGYDTVAYWTQNKPVKGSEDYITQWRGADWYFVSAEHLAMFVADPVKYAPQYGGYCAYAMSNDSFASIDEEAFTIYQDKLYLNYNKRIMKKWQADKDAYIQLANEYYPNKVTLP
ncbi:MAG: YHS domain-containing (seleno)protein [Glaciecola sp.]|nr:YHS domain-containing (seleno)protein [Glaciecola sp.]MDG1814546.1 YHS domain-containing (seleno)protein [Glaciecola sp.]MDG2099522.1 YHS domain-containing (seleno)protein [Glaciecola sp.]